MPSASSAKLEKQASSEASDPLKQGITLVEHKIRNLVKKKGRLDSYKEIQKSGKELDADQKQALLKYDEVCQNLAFAQELSKQLSGIVQEFAKSQKKKEKKEAYEREQQETAKVKEILIIQDVLASMGSDTVREDFLAGKNKAIKLSETELQYLDELFIEVCPKREPEEGQPPFSEQAQNAAKHLLSIVEGKDKEIVGTKYATLRDLIEKINNCGYFDSAAGPESASQIVGEETAAPETQSLEPVGTEAEEEPEPVPSATYQPSSSTNLEPAVTQEVTAGLFISQRPMADVLTNVMGPGPTTFNFIQESELESPDVGGVTGPVPTAMPIPTQTFTNANFAPAPAAVASVYVPPPADVMYAPVAPGPAQYSPVPPVPAQQFEPSNTFQNASQAGSGDWNDPTEQNNDWSLQVEQSEEKNQWTEPAQSDEWAENSNDGFQTAGRGGGRGGRARGRSGSRGGRGYQNGRGNYHNGRGGSGGGSNNYRNNDGTNNYHQNGYQSRGEGERGYRDNREGGQRRGAPRGGGQDRGAPRSDRGGSRGGGGRGSGNPRGGNRGNRQ